MASDIFFALTLACVFYFLAEVIFYELNGNNNFSESTKTTDGLYAQTEPADNDPISTHHTADMKTPAFNTIMESDLSIEGKISAIRAMYRRRRHIRDLVQKARQANIRMSAICARLEKDRKLSQAINTFTETLYDFERVAVFGDLTGD